MSQAASGYILYAVIDCAEALFHFATGAFTALRAYAISRRSMFLAVAVFAFSLMASAADIYAVSAAYEVTVAYPVGCVLVTDVNTIYKALTIIGQASILTSELLLVLATWRHTHTSKLREGMYANISLTIVIIRDGTIYFVTILILLVVDMALNFINAVTNGYVAPIIRALQVVLLSRFYINLHEANSMDQPSAESQMSDLRFTRVVGSLARSFSYGTNSLEPPEEDVDESVEVLAATDGSEELVSEEGSVGADPSSAEIIAV
ncbi:uncharacterized protein C8Q71DRAFT_558152 [Rhodofomes roseus]|uniref:Uncharacterized protein n=1 Tax=Rhodofomes roseus TaxID=34475 RepID=A0ABQ8KI89_9APHY|nr:uncharacterized protein C8Q71DRAFT_558152 [Rhodofomes roseus]KAH9837719.1 hypothetical protein C8Q71DRAFT_558152 [Rhodofomes roseus]